METTNMLYIHGNTLPILYYKKFTANATLYRNYKIKVNSLK